MARRDPAATSHRQPSSASFSVSCFFAQDSASSGSEKSLFGNFVGRIHKTAVMSPRSRALGTITAEPAFQRAPNFSNRLRCSANALRWVARAMVMFERSTQRGAKDRPAKLVARKNNEGYVLDLTDDILDAIHWHGHSIKAVQAQLGHRSEQRTHMYLHLGSHAQLRSVESLQPVSRPHVNDRSTGKKKGT